MKTLISSRRNHGERLLEEFEDHVSKLHERAQRRRDVVLSRLASLEDEHSVLEDLTGKLAPHAR